MIDSTYAKAYTEVLEILNYLNKKDYNKIPKYEIDLLERNCDKEYKFTIDKNKKLEEQKISKEANATLIVLFQKYFTNEQQKKRLREILMQNYEKHEEQKRLVYNTEIFKKEEVMETGVIEYKQSILSKLINKLKSFWNKIYNR